MYKQSNEAKLAYQSAERTLDIVVNVNGVDYKATDIEQFDYDSGGYTGDTFSIGSTYENNITVKFIHLVEGLKRGMIVKPRIGIKLPNGTFEYTPLGVFIIADEIQMDRNNNSTTIKAYDKFVVMEGQYVSKLTYPANAVDIITEIAQMCKVDVNTDDLAHLPTIKVSKAITKQSYRTAIGWIAQLYVGFASFDRDGKLTIRRVAEPNYTIEPSEYEQQGLVKNEAPYIIGGISCNVNVVETTNNGETNETTHKLHSGSVNGSQIELTNDIMTQSLLDSIWDSLKSITFYPFSLNWFGNPAIEAGDWLSLKDMKGNVFVVPNNGYTISFNGGLSSTSKADQNATDSSTVKYTGELTRVIENYSRRQAPDGTNIYTDVKEPTDAKFNDVWFKPNGNSTELWIFERQADGSGKWVKQPVNGEVEQKINDALKEFDELDKSFKDNANVQSSTNELMKSQIDSISNQIPNLSDEISRVNGNVTSLKTQTDKDRQQLQTTSQNLDQTRQDLLSNSNRLDKLTTQADKDRQQLQTTSQNLDKARQDVLSNSNRIDKLTVDLDSVNINVNNVNSKVDNMQVGGTNLVRNSAHDPINLEHWITNGVGKVLYATHSFFRNNTTKMFFLDNKTNQEMSIQTEYIDIEPDTDYTLSMVVFGASGVSSGDVYYNIKYADGSNTYFNVDRAFKYNPYHAEKKVYKFHTSPNSSGSKATQVFIRIDNNGLTPGYSDATCMLGDVKLEKGTIATDWSPAPEDEIERVAQIKIDLNGINATVATNKGDIAQIKLTENGMQQSIKDAQGNISTLQNDSKQFKQQFQDVNGSIATITNTANSLSSQLSTKVGTSEYNSFKNQTAQELRTKLTASDLNGYAKSADVKVSVDGLNARFDNLNVGGTNLVRNSAHDPINLDHWIINNVGSVRYSTHPLFRNGTTKMFFLDNKTNQEMMLQTEYIDIEPDADYTLSMVVFGASGVSSGDVYYNIKYKDGSDTYFNVDSKFKYNPSRAEKKVYRFHTSPNSSGSKATQVFIRIDNNGLIPGYSDATSMLGDVKLEKGTIATDWSPAPEDEIERVSQLKVDLNGMNATVATNKGDIAQIKLTETGMQQSIKDAQGNISTLQNDAKQFKQQFQDVNGNITTIKNDAKSLSSQLSTKVGTSEYNSFKEQTAQELRTKLTASDLNGYAKSADVKVSVDGLNARFDNLNIGGTNLVRKTSNTLTNRIQVAEWLFVASDGNTSTFNLDNYKGQTLTMRAWIDKPTVDAHLRTWANASNNNYAVGNTIKAGQSGYSSLVFKVPTSFTAWNIVIGNGKAAELAYKEFKVEKGTVPTDWSPAPEDMTDKIEVVSGKVTANSNEFSTVYARITNAKNDAINAIKGDSQWQSMGKIVTNASFLQNANGFAQEVVKTATPMIEGGGINLLRNSGNPKNIDGWAIGGSNPNHKLIVWQHSYWKNNQENLFALFNQNSSEATMSSKRIKVERNTNYTLSYWAFEDWRVVSSDTFFLGRKNGETSDFTKTTRLVTGRAYSSGKAEYVTVTFNTGEIDEGYIRFDNNGSKEVGKDAILFLANIKLEKGTIATDWSPSPEDLATKLQLNQVIDTADSHTRTITDYLTGSNSRFVQMANYFNMNVGSSSVSINGDGVMLSGNRIKITGKTLIDNAVILDALIKDINANTIKTKTLDASKINVTNLNANNITSGTLSGPNFSLNLDKGNMKIGIADKSKSIILDNGKIDLYASDVLSSSDYVGTITTVKGGPANHAIRIAGNDGFLIGTEDFTNNFFADGGYPWGTDPKDYVSGAGIFGHNQNLTIAAGPTRDHNTLAMVAGAIPSTDLGNVFGARAQPGFYVYGRDEAHKDLSFSAAVAPLGVSLNTSYGSITVGNTSLTAGTDKTDTSLNSSKISLTLDAPNNKYPGLTIKPTYITLGELSDGLGGLGNPELSLQLENKSLHLGADNIAINANKELVLTNLKTLYVESTVTTNRISADHTSTKDLYVSGSKNAVVPSSKGYIAINAYETAEYYFGDIGESQTDKQGVKIINLEPLFLETVNTSVPYQVFLSSYDDSKVWVFARNNNMFIVKSDKPNVKFAWEIKAKRKDYENVRLKTVDLKNERN